MGENFSVTISFYEGKHCPQFLFNKIFFKLLFETFRMLRGNLEALTWSYIREVMNF